LQVALSLLPQVAFRWEKHWHIENEGPAKGRSSGHPVRIERKKRNLINLPLALSRLII